MPKKKPQQVSRTGIALAIGLSGCGVDRAATTTEPATSAPPVVQPATTPTSTERQALDQSIEQSLGRLRELELFSVDRLVLKLPDNARDCYGVPCPGDAAGQAAYDQELRRQATRLASLVDTAQACNSGHCYLFSPTTGEEAVAALNALEIVHVGALVVTEPKNDPSCYNLPCPAEVERAKAENRRREVLAFTIASYAKER